MPLARIAAVVALLVVAGCGTASTSRDSWLYTGPDRSLDRPSGIIPPALRLEIDAERRDHPSAPLSDGLQARLIEEYVVWQARVLAALNRDRDACVAATGDSGERHFWSGYAPSFLSCMSARGWARPTGTSPL